MLLRHIIPFALILSIFSCAEKDPNVVALSGQIINPISEEVSFVFKDTSYFAPVDKSGSFTLSLKLDSATYVSFKHGFETTQMYVNPGDEISLSIDPSQYDESISYEGSAASNYLAQKYLKEEAGDFYYGPNYYMSTEEEYKSLLDEFKSSLLEELDAMEDSTFVKAEILAIDESIASMVEYQKRMSEFEMDEREYEMHKQTLTMDYNFYGLIDSLDSEVFYNRVNAYADSLELFLSKVSDQEFIKGERAWNEAVVKTLRIRKKNRDNMPKKGELAVDFTYPDITGQELSLSSFEGDLVYVDVWATWCGPCKAEIPSLKKLEADYQDKSITFLSVSVDTDKEAWKKMVQDKELGGTQLWADGWSEITKDYAIFGIPRFMLFSADGKVISTDAPRPSSDKIRDLIEANL